MRILVTGADGFIGRHLARSPLGSGFTIIPATRRAVGGSSEAFALGDRRWDLDVFRHVLAISQPDLVVHCAGSTRAPAPSAYFESNTGLASDLLSAAEAAMPRPRVVLIGSAAEYGYVPPDAMPVPEELTPKPTSHYAISKYAQTLLGMAAFERGLDVLTLRIFNAVGVGMPENLAIPSFARRMIAPAGRDTPIKVGNLDVERDFIDVKDVCRAIFTLAAYPRWPWPVVNLCSGVAVSLRHVFECLLAASGVDRPVVVDSTLDRRGEMQTIFGATSRLQSVGITAPPPNFRELAPRIIQWYASAAPTTPR